MVVGQTIQQWRPGMGEQGNSTIEEIEMWGFILVADVECPFFLPMAAASAPDYWKWVGISAGWIVYRAVGALILAASNTDIRRASQDHARFALAIPFLFAGDA